MPGASTKEQQAAQGEQVGPEGLGDVVVCRRS